MRRLNFTMDESTVELLYEVSEKFYKGNKSQTVRAALESLAVHQGDDGWVVAGYTPFQLDHDASCRHCGRDHREGSILFKPVFERGSSPSAIRHIPSEEWLECSICIENQPI